MRLARIFRRQRRPVGKIDIGRAENNDRQHHGDLDHDDDVVEGRAFLRAARQQRRQHEDYAGGGQIEQPMRGRLSGMRRPGV